MELEDIRPSIVAHNIQVVLPTHNLRAVNFRDEDGFTLRVGASKKITKWIDNATSPTADDGVGIFPKSGTIVCRKIAAAIELIAGENETTPLNGNVTHGSNPGVARVRSRRAINLDPHRVH